MKSTPMIQCPKCSAENPPENKFCGTCAQPLSSLSQMPTMGIPEAESPGLVETPHVARIISSDSIPAGGFTPGTILADRYRIIGLLGRGGMGEVYRADDLKLGQPVALKFLPPKLAEDPVRRERFFAEVRITRQLSHPNICRVYDIGEIDGRHFLSMEFIDGEDLSSLLKRIGHLTNEKALDIARQLAAGLAAAHERGVLHRDLKPANIMLDGHGRVRITDFGLAIAVEDESQAAEIAGTPAYMAPEQLAGKGATVRSDMYSLGLVLYEIYTGKKAFTATNLAELRQQKETHTPRAPSEIREGIDPVVERVIQRCMEKDPNARPSSVAQLAQALPGGDPLAAAIAAGETPSPEMVAVSESTEGLKPWIAWSCLAFIILSIGTFFILTQQTSILYRVPIEQPPEVMVKTAQDILKDLGYTEEHADSAFRFMSATSKYFDYVVRTDKSSDRFEKIPALTIQFWYRQSPMLLLNLGVEQAVTLSDPPFLNNGESIVWLDSRGRLAGLRVIPPQKPKQPDAVRPPNWSMLFKAAGLDEKSFNDAETESIPPVYADTRAAWTGTLPDFPDTAVRIEAAAYQGRPVFWQMIVPSWDNFTTATLPSGQILPGRAYSAVTVILAIVVVLILVAGPAFFAHRNLCMGRGDRRGATRLVLFSIGLWFISWVFNEHHIAAAEEVYLFIITVAWCLLFHGWYWLMYIAFEPFTRRRLPRVLVGWSRLLAGKYRDPLVGRDLLVGFVTGIMFALIEVLIVKISHSLGDPELTPFMPELTFFAGPRWIVEGFLRVVVGSSILLGLSIAFIVFLLRILLRSTWATAIVPILLFSSLVFVFPSSAPLRVAITIIATLYVGFLLYVFLRFGLVSLMAFIFVILSLHSFPITIQQSAWYFEIGLTGLVLLLIFVLYAFHTSLGGRPIFGRASLED